MAAATLTFTVSEDDTASALGSGDLPVLATPRLLAWCEAATCAAVGDRLPPGSTSVGTAVDLEHVRPSAVGRVVEVTALLVDGDERTLRFEVTATHSRGAGTQAEPIGRGQVTRAVVEVERFLRRLN